MVQDWLLWPGSHHLVGLFPNLTQLDNWLSTSVQLLTSVKAIHTHGLIHTTMSIGFQHQSHTNMLNPSLSSVKVTWFNSLVPAVHLLKIPSITSHSLRVMVYGNNQPIKLYNQIQLTRLQIALAWIILVQEFFNYLIQILNNSSITKQSASLVVLLFITTLIQLMLMETMFGSIKLLINPNHCKFLWTTLLLTLHSICHNVHHLDQVHQLHQLLLMHSKHGSISKSQRTILTSITLLVHQKHSGFNNSIPQPRLVYLYLLIPWSSVTTPGQSSGTPN